MGRKSYRKPQHLKPLLLRYLPKQLKELPPTSKKEHHKAAPDPAPHTCAHICTHTHTHTQPPPPPPQALQSIYPKQKLHPFKCKNLYTEPKNPKYEFGKIFGIYFRNNLQETSNYNWSKCTVKTENQIHQLSRRHLSLRGKILLNKMNLSRVTFL